MAHLYCVISLGFFPFVIIKARFLRFDFGFCLHSQCTLSELPWISVMLPPSSFFLHQQVDAPPNMREQSAAATPSPPHPPYSLAAPALSLLSDGAGTDVAGIRYRPGAYGDLDEEVDDIDEYETHHEPMTVNIDASICVLGNSNIIAISVPTGQNETRNDVGPADLNSTSESPMSSSSAESSSSQTTAPLLHAIQKQRQARLAELATSIVANLFDRKSCCFGSRGMCTRHKAPVHIRINTGVRIEGSRNVVCAALANRTSPKTKADGNERSQSAGRRNGDKDSTSRKRHAQSVSTELPI